ncbi:unnamed protein product [Amaranthus hypochondriacus]
MAREMLERDAVRNFQTGNGIRRAKHAYNGRKQEYRGNYYGWAVRKDATPTAYNRPNSTANNQNTQLNGREEDGGWQLVNRRRQRRHHTNNQDIHHGLRSISEASAGHRGYSRHRWWRGPREPPRLGHCVVTLFVDGIPRSVSLVEIRQLFEKEGTVDDVYISGRKRKNSTVGFGFVRFSKRVEAEAAIKNLDNFKLHGCKLKVSMAKYQRGGQPVTIDVERVKQKPRKVIQQPYIPALRDNRKYKEVVRGARKEVPSRTGNEKMNDKAEKETTRGKGTRSMKVIEDPALMEKLNRAVVVRLDAPMDPKQMASRLENTNIPIEYMSYLAPSKFMLFFDDETELVAALDENSQLRSMFTDVRRWTENENVNTRLAWLECSGINPKFWCLEYIQEIGEQWGKTIHIDHDFYGVNCLTNAKMLIETAEMRRIDEYVRMEWNGGYCEVWVRETTECHCKGKNVLENWSDSEDEKIEETCERNALGNDNIEHCEMENIQVNSDDEREVNAGSPHVEMADQFKEVHLGDNDGMETINPAVQSQCMHRDMGEKEQQLQHNRMCEEMFELEPLRIQTTVDNPKEFDPIPKI